MIRISAISFLMCQLFIEIMAYNVYLKNQKNAYFRHMDIKKILGLILTILGIGGLIYTAILYVNGTGEFKILAVYGILGAIFFFSGMGLIRNLGSSNK